MRKPKKSAKVWLARDNNNNLWVFATKPEKSILHGQWINNRSYGIILKPELFPDVKWEDKEPTKAIIKI